MGLTRSFTVKYGDKTVGINETRLDSERGKMRVSQTVETFSIEFGFILIGTSSLNLENETDDLEAAFKEIRQDVTITINGQTAWSFKHSTNTGFNSRATLSKVGGPKDGGLSRAFAVKIEVGLPFNDSGLDGRRSSQVSVSFSPHRKIVLNISGEYVCQSGTVKSALENYYRAIEAYVTSVKTLLGSTAEDYSSGASEDSVTLVFERVAEDYSYDDQNKVLNFSISEEEILYKQDSAGDPVDNPNIFNQSLAISMSRQWPGDSPHLGGDNFGNKYRVTKVTATYSCLVKKNLDDQGTEPTDLETVYKDTIKPFLLKEISTITEFQGAVPGITTITEESVSFDKTNLGINATLICDIMLGGEQGNQVILQKSITVSDDEKPGNYLVPVWGTGKQPDESLLKYLFRGPGSHVRKITAVYRVLGTTMPASNKDIITFFGDAVNMGEVTPEGGGWVVMGRHADSTVIEIGTPPENPSDQYTITDYTISTTGERYVPVTEQFVPPTIFTAGPDVPPVGRGRTVVGGN